MAGEAPPIAERHPHYQHRRAPIKEPVRVAATANVNTSTGLNPGDTIDGKVLADGDRVLLPVQSTGSQNGLWIAAAVPVRAYDQSTDDPAFGFLVYVIEGTVNGGLLYRNTNTSIPTIGSTSLTFATVAGGLIALDDLTDVTITSAAAGQKLRFNGSGWVNVQTWHEPQFDYTGSAILDGAGNPIMVEVVT